jgi:8-oxo-dGTP pyrophosphatase MutT (NUDIX family)
MRWIVESQRSLYRDKWLEVLTADVRLPDGRHLDHRSIRSANGAHAVLIDADRVLLMWRHRFITDTWGWEVPGGAIDVGEQPVDAAAREVEEETGWRPLGPLRRLVSLDPMSGLMMARHHIFRGEGATYIGPPTHGYESDRIEWVPLGEVRGLIEKGEVLEGTTLTALLCLLALT